MHSLTCFPQRSVCRLLPGGVLLCFVFALLCGCRKPSASQPTGAVEQPPAEVRNSPPATAATYVADAACTQCHAEIAQRYATHPMAHSLSSGLSEVAADARKPAKLQVGPIEYATHASPTGLIHARRLTPSRDEPLTEQFPVAYVVGSGRRGQSYLVTRGQRLLMSPLTWYARTAAWGPSPGYESHDLGFDRPVLGDCLFCHSNGAARVEQTKNAYAQPTFPRGEGIGCQRCHGPGSDHIQRHQAGTPNDAPDSIVNPASLAAVQREAVCQQCHLAGAARIERAGRSRYDFRPGETLDATIATYVLTDSKAPEAVHFVGQVEQMVTSQCYQQSQGALGCISCHDPHGIPSAAERATFYRDRCLNCHEDEGCTQPLLKRQTAEGVDDCTRCHMPRMPTDVRHTAATDHRVLRSPLTPESSAPKTSFPLEPFPARSVGDETERGRDLAMAVLQAAPYHRQRFVESHFAKVIRPLQQAVQQNPLDLAGMEALGDLERHLDRRGAADRYQSVLRQQPSREHSLVLSAAHLSAQRQWTQAAEAWQRVCQMHGPNPAYRARYVEALAAAGRWEQVKEVSRAGTQEFPFEPRLWRVATESYLREENEAEAAHALGVLKQLLPEDHDALDHWFRNHRFRR